MALNIIDKFPGLKDMEVMRKYARYLHTADFRIDPLLWIICCVVLSLVAALFGIIVTGALHIDQGLQVSALAFILVLDLTIGYPYLRAAQRIAEIEELMPDALRQMADTLKSGGTYELALKEVATSDYGPLRAEVNEVIRKLEEGENFETAFGTLSKNIDSKLVKRTVTIVVDAVRAGAALSSILEQISEDVRELQRIGKDRKASTAMQVVFMFAAGAVIAPMIFGFVSTIAFVLVHASASASSPEIVESAKQSIGLIGFAVEMYIFIETFFTAMMMAIMRDGGITKTIIYYPILLLIAYVTYLAAGLVSRAVIGG